jgi:hypothetical protein
MNAGWPKASRSAKSSKEPSAAEAAKPAAKLASPPPETIAKRNRRIRAEKAAAEAAELEALARLLQSVEGLLDLVGVRWLLKRSEHVAWTNNEWNELEEVCRKFRAFFPKLTLIQCELIARTHMKTNALSCWDCRRRGMFGRTRRTLRNLTNYSKRISPGDMALPMR